MSTVNYSDTTPAAPTGSNNVKWQSDASGNLSAYDPFQSWQTWTPTISPQGGMTMSPVTNNTARYVRIGPIVFFQFTVSGTLGGTLSNSIWLSPPPIAPVPLSGLAQVVAVEPYQGSAQLVAGVVVISAIQCATTSANFLAGAVTLQGSGFYCCA